MSREAHIPIVLWVLAAALVHLAGGGGVSEVATTIVDRAQILAFSRLVRHEVRPEDIELDIASGALADEEAVEQRLAKRQQPKPTESKDEEAEPPAEQDREDQPKPRPQRLSKPAPQPLLPKPEPKPKPKKIAEIEPKKDQPKPPQAKPPKKKVPPEKQLAAKDKPKQQTPLKLLIPQDKRIAIINDPTLDKNQPDNPNAHRIADVANHAKEETMARFRAYDQNSAKPTGGAQLTPGPQDQVGNSHELKRGFSAQSEKPGPPRGGLKDDSSDKPAEIAKRSSSAPAPPPGGQAADPGRQAIAAVKGGTGAKLPESLAVKDSSWSISPRGGDGKKKQQARVGRSGLGPIPQIPGLPGFGIPGLTKPGKYTLTQQALLDALGPENLKAEREKARNARITRHRGTMKGTDFKRYKAAIENYDPSVKLGNQTSLNAARVPFASYINKAHNQIHPIFADGFLASLSKLSATDKLNQSLVTHLELVLDGDTGAVVRMGITKPSGVTAFDVAALRSVDQAAPFGKAPDLIVSSDGNVYLHWEFHRDPFYACTSRFARPYILKNPPKFEPEPHRLPRPPAPPSADQRYSQKRGPLLPLAEPR